MTPAREKTCCFTGHRSIAKDKVDSVLEKLNMEVHWLISHGFTDFIAGGAIGFDTLAALTVIRIREEGAPIRLHLALPCREQERLWREEDKVVYRGMLERADDLLYLCDHFHNGVMHMRNRYMVEHSSTCVCYYNKNAKPSSGSGGGTLYTVNYARKHGLTVINLHDEPPDDGQLEFNFSI